MIPSTGLGKRWRYAHARSDVPSLLRNRCFFCSLFSTEFLSDSALSEGTQMGRVRDALRVLLGRSEIANDHRYILRTEVPALVTQLAELEVSVASALEKLNALAARQRKREQRAAAVEFAETATDVPADPNPSPGHPGESKAILRSRFAASRLASIHNGVR
jgi:hypothetical protein